MNVYACVNVIGVLVLVKTESEVEWGAGLAELYVIPVLSRVQDTKPC